MLFCAHTLDGLHRTGVMTERTLPATVLYRTVSVKWSVCENRDEPNPGPILGIDQKQAFPLPPQAGHASHSLVGDSAIPVLLVQNLRRWNGKSIKTVVLKDTGAPPGG